MPAKWLEPAVTKDALWAEEAERRLRLVDSGEMPVRDAADVLAEFRKSRRGVLEAVRKVRQDQGDAGRERGAIPRLSLWRGRPAGMTAVDTSASGRRASQR